MDRLTKEHRSWLMSRVRGKDTKPEWTVRRLLHRLGYRFRVHGKELPGTPDIVFGARKKAIFVHGCFWHGHGCRIGKAPKSRADYWLPKIEANKARDASKARQLTEAGWDVLTVWQCQTGEESTLASDLRNFLGPTKNPIDIQPMNG